MSCSMRAKVIAINHKKNVIAVATANGITVFELLGGYEVELDDVISGRLESLGNEIFRNETRQENLDVYVQGIHCSPQNARQLMA